MNFFLWTVEYKDTSYNERDGDGEEYTVVDFDVKKDDSGKKVESESYGTISNDYRKMLDLAANLFNSSNDEFNLMDSLGTWDDDLIKVYYQAILLRLEGRRKIEGVSVIIQ
ncbi:MAG: hypothetical protein ACQEWV_29745 [Bacillota bacterium]